VLILRATADLLRVITTVGGSQIEAHVSFVDILDSAAPPVVQFVDVVNTANITTATTTTILDCTTANHARRVLFASLHNNHASVTEVVEVVHSDGSTVRALIHATLLAGESLVYNGSGTWLHYTSDGVLKNPGQLTELVIGAAGAAAVTLAATDTLKLFARKRAGMMRLKYIKPSGVDEEVQDKLSENGFSMYLPNNGTTVGLNYGLAWTSGGTVSHPTPSAGIINQQKRTRWANVTTTTDQFLGLRVATAEKRYWRGNAAGLGGFNFHARFSIGLWPAATVRLFVGLNDSNSGWAISNTLTGNGCGFWHDTTEAATVLTFVTRDGTTATKSAGITLTTGLAAGQGFDAYIWSAPNGSVIGYALIDQANGNVLVDTTTSTTIPLSTAFLGQEISMSNGTANTTADTVGIQVSAHSCQSDN